MMIEFDHVSLKLGGFALHEVSLTIKQGDYYFIMGPSGAGKTILLEALAGLHIPDNGRILLKGEDITGIPPEKRKIGLVYQDYSLFPHMTVEKNIGFGLKMQGICNSERKQSVDTLMKKLGVDHLARRAPLTLSGGEMQRVAIARALVTAPEILLLDEPLSALDPPVRDFFVEELRELHREQELTIVQVTHERHEALNLGSRMALIRDGRLEQEGAVDDVFARPRTRAAAEFMGFENIIPGIVSDAPGCMSRINTGKVSFLCSTGAISKENVTLCIRADDISVQEKTYQGTERDNTFPGRITALNPSGPLIRLDVDIGLNIVVVMSRKVFLSRHLEKGFEIVIAVSPDNMYLIPSGIPGADDFL
jgi:molybdate/tungstate transport system ATP-binding protein